MVLVLGRLDISFCVLSYGIVMRLFLCVRVLCDCSSLVILTVYYHGEWWGVVKLDLCAVLSQFGSVCEQWLPVFRSKRCHTSAIVGEDLESLLVLPGECLLKPVGFMVTGSAGVKLLSNRNKYFTRATHSTEYLQMRGRVKIDIADCF